MDKKQLRMLHLFDGVVSKCEICFLFQNGRAKPYWSESFRYAIIGEARAEEIRELTFCR